MSSHCSEDFSINCTCTTCRCCTATANDALAVESALMGLGICTTVQAPIYWLPPLSGQCNTIAGPICLRRYRLDIGLAYVSTLSEQVLLLASYCNCPLCPSSSHVFRNHAIFKWQIDGVRCGFSIGSAPAVRSALASATHYTDLLPMRSALASAMHYTGLLPMHDHMVDASDLQQRTTDCLAPSALCSSVGVCSFVYRGKRQADQYTGQYIFAGEHSACPILSRYCPLSEAALGPVIAQYSSQVSSAVYGLNSHHLRPTVETVCQQHAIHFSAYSNQVHGAGFLPVRGGHQEST